MDGICDSEHPATGARCYLEGAHERHQGWAHYPGQLVVWSSVRSDDVVWESLVTLHNKLAREVAHRYNLLLLWALLRGRPDLALMLMRRGIRFTVHGP